MGQSSSNRRRRDHNNYPHPPNPSPPSYPYLPPNPQIYAPPPPPPPTSYATNPIDHGITTLMRVFDSLMGRVAYTPQYPPQYYYGPTPLYAAASSSASAAAAAATTRQQMPQFVEQQKAKTVKNDVNVHKDTIRLEVDERNPDRHLVSFVFDAVSDGRYTGIGGRATRLVAALISEYVSCLVWLFLGSFHGDELTFEDFFLTLVYIDDG